MESNVEKKMGSRAVRRKSQQHWEAGEKEREHRDDSLVSV